MPNALSRSSGAVPPCAAANEATPSSNATQTNISRLLRVMVVISGLRRDKLFQATVGVNMRRTAGWRESSTRVGHATRFPRRTRYFQRHSTIVCPVQRLVGHPTGAPGVFDGPAEAMVTPRLYIRGCRWRHLGRRRGVAWRAAVGSQSDHRIAQRLG